MLHFIAFGLSLLGLARSFFPGVQNAPVSVFSEKTPLAPVISQPVNARIRNPKVQAEACDSAYRMKPVAIENGEAMGGASHGSFLQFRQVDLKNVEKLTYRLSVAENATLELHLDSPTGPLVSSLPCEKTGNGFAELSAPFRLSPGVYDLYFVVNAPAAPETELLQLDWIYFHRKTTMLPRLGG